MKILGLDLDDNVVREYFAHCTGTENYEHLESETKHAIHTELGIDNVEEAISVYGKEEVELQVIKVLNEMIEALWIPGVSEPKHPEYYSEDILQKSHERAEENKQWLSERKSN